MFSRNRSGIILESDWLIRVSLNECPAQTGQGTRYTTAMAGILDEFDDATPMRNKYCSTLTLEEYEEQSANSTEEALAELIAHLESNPQQYKNVLKARKRDEAEEAGVLSYIKVKFCSFFTGDDGCGVSEDECSKQLEQLKENLIKSYNYSQESKGRRFSRRLVDRRARRELEKMGTPSRGQGDIPAPPPPPPLPLPGIKKQPSLTPAPSAAPKRPGVPPKPPGLTSCSATPIVHATLTRRPLSSRPVRQPVKRKQSGGDLRQDLLKQIKGSECKKRLKKVAKKSPISKGSSRQHKDSDLLPFFNTKLLNKFKNVQSPASSPTLASPGSFESPVSTPPLSQPSEPKKLKTGGPFNKKNSKSAKSSLRDQENILPMEVQ